MPQELIHSAADYLPAQPTYSSLCKASMGCHGCDLYKGATQTIFGEGPPEADLMLVGEQPGDEEDKAGHPFIGPAGQVLAKCLEDAFLDRRRVYITNAVKHFKFEVVGKRRLHKKPSALEISACRPWLDAEIKLIKPKAVVCLGTTSARSLFGTSFKLVDNLGKWRTTPTGTKVLATFHPSAALRASSRDARDKICAEIVKALFAAKEA